MNVKTKSKLFIGVTVFFILLLGCVKLPDNVNYSNIRINYSNIEGKEEYTLIFSCDMQNDNPNTVLIDLIADIKVSLEQNTEVFQEVFQVKAKSILPFNMGILESVQKRTKEEIMPLIKALNVDEKELMATGTISGIFLKPMEVQLINVKCSRMNIKEYLKEKTKEQ